MNTAGALVPPPEKAGPSRAKRVIWISALGTFLVVFGGVACMGADRLRNNPVDVLGTAALFATLASLLAARLAWRFSRRK